MSYIIYRKIPWTAESWYMVGRKQTQEEAINAANRLFSDWENVVPNPPTHKVCHSSTNEEVYRIE